MEKSESVFLGILTNCDQVTYMKKEIVDNETDNYTMGRFLTENISKENSKIDIASGYFNPSGFNILRKALWEATKSPDFAFRLLFGRDATRREYTSSEIFGSSPSKDDQPLTEEIDSLKISERSAEIIDDLIKFLKLQSVAVRRNEQRFNHAKCYNLLERECCQSTWRSSHSLGIGRKNRIDSRIECVYSQTI